MEKNNRCVYYEVQELLLKYKPEVKLLNIYYSMNFLTSEEVNADSLRCQWTYVLFCHSKLTWLPLWNYLKMLTLESESEGTFRVI